MALFPSYGLVIFGSGGTCAKKPAKKPNSPTASRSSKTVDHTLFPFEYEPLSPEEERELLASYQKSRSHEVGLRILASIKPLMIERTNRLPFQMRADFAQELMLDAWKKLDSFDLTQNTRFSTYVLNPRNVKGVTQGTSAAASGLRRNTFIMSNQLAGLKKTLECEHRPHDPADIAAEYARKQAEKNASGHSEPPIESPKQKPPKTLTPVGVRRLLHYRKLAAPLRLDEPNKPGDDFRPTLRDPRTEQPSEQPLNLDTLFKSLLTRDQATAMRLRVEYPEKRRAELAEILGSTPKRVKNLLEQARKRLSKPDTLAQLARHLGIPADALTQRVGIIQAAKSNNRKPKPLKRNS